MRFELGQMTEASIADDRSKLSSRRNSWSNGPIARSSTFIATTRVIDVAFDSRLLLQDRSTTMTWVAEFKNTFRRSTRTTHTQSARRIGPTTALRAALFKGAIGSQRPRSIATRMTLLSSPPGVLGKQRSGRLRAKPLSGETSTTLIRILRTTI